jgi:serine/threonine protein kinase
MDIKQRNILVKVSNEPEDAFGFRVYIADFGISRTFSHDHQSETESRSPITRNYCAPEVADFGRWGRSADVFSLGCVFLEMQTALCRRLVEEFEEFRSSSTEETSFHENLPRVLEWCQKLKGFRPVYAVNFFDDLENQKYIADTEHPHSFISRGHRFCDLLQTMFAENPDERPKIESIILQIQDCTKCCIAGPVDFKEESHSLEAAVKHKPLLDRFLSLAPVQRYMVLVRVVEAGDKQLANSVFSVCKSNGIKLEEVRNERGNTLHQIEEINGYI